MVSERTNFSEDFIILNGSLTKSIDYQKMYFDNGALKSEGKFVDGVKEGPWKYYFEKGGLQADADAQRPPGIPVTITAASAPLPQGTTQRSL